MYVNNHRGLFQKTAADAQVVNGCFDVDVVDGQIPDVDLGKVYESSDEGVGQCAENTDMCICGRIRKKRMFVYPLLSPGRRSEPSVQSFLWQRKPHTLCAGVKCQFYFS